MRHDIQTFLDLTDIDTSKLLQVDVVLIPSKDAVYQFTVNGIQLNSLHSMLHFDLLANLKFNCNISSGHVEVALIKINDREVMPVYLHLANPATNWITTPWEFNIPGPFYPWYHEITGQGWIA